MDQLSKAALVLWNHLAHFPIFVLNQTIYMWYAHFESNAFHFEILRSACSSNTSLNSVSTTPIMAYPQHLLTLPSLLKSCAFSSEGAALQTTLHLIPILNTSTPPYPHLCSWRGVPSTEEPMSRRRAPAPAPPSAPSHLPPPPPGWWWKKLQNIFPC